jgi:hypothetical protein
MHDQHIDPKIVADQQGHGVDVNLNVYVGTPLKRKKQAVDQLDAAVKSAREGQSEVEPIRTGSIVADLIN